MSMCTLVIKFLPICQRELGAGTEYGFLLVKPAGHLLAPPNGSIARSALRTRSLVTFRPLLLKLPQIIWTPEYGISCLISIIRDTRSSSLISWLGSSRSPYSSLRLEYIHAHI